MRQQDEIESAPAAVSTEQQHGLRVSGFLPEHSPTALPHERDESAQPPGDRLDEALSPSRQKISQAHDDIERGLVDTERRAKPDDVPSLETRPLETRRRT